MLDAQQLAERMTGIGGSEAAAACGRSPWMTPLELYMQKTGQIAPPDLTKEEVVHFGNVLEDVVADEWARRNNTTIRRDKRTLRAATHPFMLGHIDRRVQKDTRGLECKTASFRVAQKWGHGEDEGDNFDEKIISDEIPEEYLFQCHHYLAITHWDAWHVAVLIAGNDYRQYTVERDDEMIKLLMEQEGEFWRRVELRDPPPPMTENDCKLLWPSHVPGKRTLANNDLIAAVEQLKDLKARAKVLADAMEAPTLAIKVALADADELITPDSKVLCTYRQAKASLKFDQEAFALKHPDLWQQFQKSVPGSRRLLLKK